MTRSWQSWRSGYDFLRDILSAVRIGLLVKLGQILSNLDSSFLSGQKRQFGEIKAKTKLEVDVQYDV